MRDRPVAACGAFPFEVTGAAIGRTGAVSEKARPTIGTAKGQYLPSGADIAVLLPLIAEGFAGEFALGLFGSFQHRDMRDGAAIGDERQERSAAIGGVGRDTLWPIAEPIVGPCQHGPPRIDFRGEAGGTGLHVDRHPSRRVNQDIEGIAEPAPRRARRPCRRRIGA